MKKAFLLLILVVVVALFFGCDLSRDSESTEINWNFTFDSDEEGFEAIFSDYHDDGRSYESYRMEYGHREIPVVGKESMGLYIASMNRSDDIFMGFVKELDGLLVNQRYTFEVSFQLATDVDPSMGGIGGDPGGSVFVKGGVAIVKPESTLNSDEGMYRMNIDIGQQSSSGRDMIAIGNMAKPENMAGVAGFIFKEMGFTFQATTGSNGHAYLIIGTDSGYEGYTQYYLDNIEVKAIQR